MNPFKKGDKVVCIDHYATFPALKMGHNYLVDDVNNVSGEEAIWISGLGCWYRASRFKIVEEQPKPASFKDFLSPMCRVELRNGSKWIYVGGEFITKGDWHGSEYQYYADGKLRGTWESCTSQGYEIVKVFDKPKSPAQYLDVDVTGKLLWECPELAAERKKKEEKKSVLLKEIKEWEAKRESNLLQANSATSVINDLEKQLKEIE